MAPLLGSPCGCAAAVVVETGACAGGEGEDHTGQQDEEYTGHVLQAEFGCQVTLGLLLTLTLLRVPVPEGDLGDFAQSGNEKVINTCISSHA